MRTSALPIPKHPFLVEMNEGHAHKLLEGAVEQPFQAGDILFREGEPANRFYLIESGEVAVETTSAGSGVVHVQTLHGGDVLGWSWMFPPFIWHFRARAIQPTRVICCDGGRLLVASEEDPVFGHELMKRVAGLLIQRLQATRKRLVQLESVISVASAAMRN